MAVDTKAAEHRSLFWQLTKAAEPCVRAHAADVAFEMSMNDNLLTGTVPAELQYLPLRVRTAFFSQPLNFVSVCAYNAACAIHVMLT